MSIGQRRAIYATVGALWLSGCAWLALDECCARRGPFGNAPHPLEPPLLLVHGVIAIGSMYLFGWISARHVLRWWPGAVRRWSGGALSATIAALALTGFALFFLTDDLWQHAAALTHDALGLAVTLFAVRHWFFGRLRT